jgi:hypothetical protein
VDAVAPVPARIEQAARPEPPPASSPALAPGLATQSPSPSASPTQAQAVRRDLLLEPERLKSGQPPLAATPRPTQ